MTHRNYSEFRWLFNFRQILPEKKEPSVHIAQVELKFWSPSDKPNWALFHRRPLADRSTRSCLTWQKGLACTHCIGSWQNLPKLPRVARVTALLFHLGATLQNTTFLRFGQEKTKTGTGENPLPQKLRAQRERTEKRSLFKIRGRNASKQQAETGVILFHFRCTQECQIWQC